MKTVLTNIKVATSIFYHVISQIDDKRLTQISYTPSFPKSTLHLNTGFSYMSLIFLTLHRRVDQIIDSKVQGWVIQRENVTNVKTICFCLHRGTSSRVTNNLNFVYIELKTLFF